MENIDDFAANLEECLKDSVFEDTICKKPKRLTKNPSKKRQRKTKEQMKILEKYYEENDDWSNDLVEEISQQTNLKSKQVSKWFWDQKTKKKTPAAKSGKTKKTHKRVKTMEVEPLEDFSNISNAVKPPTKPKLVLNTRAANHKKNLFNIKAPCFAPEQPEVVEKKSLGIRIPCQKKLHDDKLKSPSFTTPQEAKPKAKFRVHPLRFDDKIRTMSKNL